MTNPVVVRLDVVPANATVTVPGGDAQVYQGLRVIVTSDAVYAWRDTTKGPELLLEGKLDDFGGRNTVGYFATVDGGGRIDFSRGGGCACGSRVKAFRPFPQGMVQGAYAIQ